MNSGIWAKAWHVWRVKLQPVALLILLLTSFRSAVADWNDVPTGSMKPSIIEGDRIVVNKLAYGLKLPFTTWHLLRWDSPRRGEIVIFNSPIDGTRLVKRIVALPGDVVLMLQNRLIINGESLEYSPLADDTIKQLPSTERVHHEFASEAMDGDRHAVMSTPGTPAIRNFGPLVVPAGEYFVLGDNRDNSADSRYIGTVPIDQILGRTTWIALSLDYLDHYLPRWGRFLRSID